MVLDGFVWNTSPGACELEPPARCSGPCSRTVTFLQPRAANSSARLAPTIPAPMMTTRGVGLMRQCSFKWPDGTTGVEQDTGVGGETRCSRGVPRRGGQVGCRLADAAATRTLRPLGRAGGSVPL